MRTIKSAEIIASAVGYLPLALIHAGASIHNKLCTLDSYTGHFERAWKEIRRSRSRIRWQVDEDEEDYHSYLSVYSSYEILFHKLQQSKSQHCRDAAELLETFAFFNREDIRFDTLVAAARKPGLEIAAQSKEAVEAKAKAKETPTSWAQLLQSLVYGTRVVGAELMKNRSPIILPTILDDYLQGIHDMVAFKRRLRKALLVLTQWSLMTYHEKTGSYSMHPLVHAWVRHRPGRTLGEQAVWSQAAANCLAQSIPLPTNDTLSTREIDTQRNLLLHVIHVRTFQAEIRQKYSKNQLRARLRVFPMIKPVSDLFVTNCHQALQAIKFSCVYFLCGYFQEAQALQEAARDFLLANLGLEHPLSLRALLLLAKTYWAGGRRFDDAATLTEQALRTAKKLYGDRHSTTLNAINELGIIRLHQGRFAEAELLLQQAIKGRTELHGPNHQNTLCSIDNLGQVYWSMSSCEAAKFQHLKAIAGMESHCEMGPDHEKTLAARENLALAYRELGQAHYQTAHDIMEEVVQKRSKLMGEESPFTLMARSNLAYIKHAMGANLEAEEMIRRDLPVATRNLGSDHPGVLAMKRRLADILAAQEKNGQAEKLVVQVLDGATYVDGHDILRRQVYATEVNDNCSEISDHSEASSTVSIFSNDSMASGSSMSSLAGAPGAIERLVALLLVDSTIKSLCIKALDSAYQEHVEKNLRRLLKDFGVELSKEATTPQQRRTAQFVRLRARNTAHMICNALKPDTRVTSLAMPKAKTLELDFDESSESDRSDGEMDDLNKLEAFVKASKAIGFLRETLRAFTYPSETQIKRYIRGERTYPTQCLRQEDESETANIQLTVRSQVNETLQMTVPSSYTIEQIKSRLDSLRGPPVKWRLLIFRADEFVDGVSLVQYDIENGEVSYDLEANQQSPSIFAMNQDGKSFGLPVKEPLNEPIEGDQDLLKSDEVAGVDLQVNFQYQPTTSNVLRRRGSSPSEDVFNLEKQPSQPIQDSPLHPKPLFHTSPKSEIILDIRKNRSFVSMGWLRGRFGFLKGPVQRLYLMISTTRPKIENGKIRVEWQCASAVLDSRLIQY